MDALMRSVGLMAKGAKADEGRCVFSTRALPPSR
jgi:hypothetical protein